MKLKLITAAVCLCLLSGAASAQQVDDEKLVDKWMKFYAERAAKYEMVVDDDSDRKLELRDTPLLRYTNPVRQRGQHGAVFAWTLDGRPQVIGTIWSIIDQKNNGLRRVAHELHSLSPSSLAVTRPPAVQGRLNTNRVVGSWQPPKPGAEFQKLETELPAPTTATARLAQMRRLAKKFTAVVIDRKSGKPNPLRLLTSPLMRYQSKENGVVDGTVFAFTLATDPELFLVLECRAGEGEELVWHYAPARFTGLALRLNFDDQQVWQCEQIAGGAPNQIYNLNFGVSVLPADFPVK